MLKGTIVENSLKDKSILGEIKIDNTYQSEDWILHDFWIDENKVSRLSNCIAEGPWYIHLWEPGKDDVWVIFKDKTFKVKHSDKSTWARAVEFGKSIGIPEEQLDFVIK